MILIGRDDEPFWVVELMELTKTHMRIKFYGGYGFMKKYVPLRDPFSRDSSKHWIKEVERRVTVLDWGFKLKKDQCVPISVLKNVSDDQRIEWTYRADASAPSRRRKKRRRKD